MSTLAVRAPNAPSQATELGAWPSMCFHGWKWSLTNTDSNPACSAWTEKSSSLPGANCSADALYPSLSTVMLPHGNGEVRRSLNGPQCCSQPPDGPTQGPG